MACEACYHLLAAYQRSVILFRDAVRKGSGAIGDDSKLASEEARRLSQQCKEANDRLMAHWRQDHPSQPSAGHAG
jgi:hypothetical protein